MAKEPKQFKIKLTHTRRGDKIIEGTLEYLIEYFGNTFEVGNSWNKKINKKPRTIRSFVTNLQNSYEELEVSCYARTFVELID